MILVWKEHFIHCDICTHEDNRVESFNETKRKTRAEAKKFGWIYKDYKDICPDCKEKYNAQNTDTNC